MLQRVLLILSLGWATALGLLVPAAAMERGPQALVEETSERMLEILAENREEIEAHPDRLYDLVSDIVLPYFDFARMAQWALGKHWRTATDSQKQRFTEAFRNLLVRTYSTALLEYTDQEIRYLPLRMDQDANEATVRTEILQGAGNAIPIDYRMYHQPDGWKVYDITVDGISLVTNYRSTFSSEIRSKGMDALIDRLQQRNQQDSQP